MQHPGPHYGTATVPGMSGAWVPTGATSPDWGAPQPLPSYSTPMKEMEGKTNSRHEENKHQNWLSQYEPPKCKFF